MTRISLADVRRSIRSDIPSPLLVRWFGRPLGNLLTPFFHSVGFSANQLSVGRGVVSVVGVLFMAVPDPRFWAASALIHYFDYALDCVDGNLARLHGSVSYFGKFLDGAVDGIFHFWAPVLAGVGGWQYFGDVWPLVLGSMITALSLTAHMMRTRLSFIREWMTGQTGPLSGEQMRAAGPSRRVQDLVAPISINGRFLASAALFIPEWGLFLFLAMLVVVQLLPEVLGLAATLSEANATLRRPRRSKHSPDGAPRT